MADVIFSLRRILLPLFDLPEVGSSRFSWLVELLSLELEELEAALDQCNNSCPGLDGLRFYLFIIFNEGQPSTQTTRSGQGTSKEKFLQIEHS
jgi:hypothetical protein